MSGQPRIGLLAAWGRFPLLVAESLRRQGYHISCAAVVDLADPALASICDDFQWIGWGKLGGTVKFFRRCGINQATMAGKFHKALLYQPGLWWRHFPDWKFVKTFYRHFTRQRNNNDDKLLGALTDAFNLMLVQIEERDAALRHNEERFRQLANAVPAFVWTCDASGASVYFNEPWYEYTGRTPAESLGLKWTEALHHEDRDRYVLAWHNAVREKQPFQVEGLNTEISQFRV